MNAHVPGGHPLTDPGDGRTECRVCGKWIFPAIHSCKGLPVTDAAMARATLAKLERPESPRTAAATAARRRQSEERAAARLRDRGWAAIPPEGYESLPEETQQLVNAVSGV